MPSNESCRLVRVAHAREDVASKLAVIGILDQDRPMEIDLVATLRAARRQAGLSQRELAERAGVPTSTVARIESGSTTNPRLRMVERLLQAAGRELGVREAAEAIVAAPIDDRAEKGPRDGLDSAIPDVPHDGLRDASGRRYPAHLDLRATYPFLGRDYRLLSAGTPIYTFEIDRDVRDERREKEAPAMAAEIVRVADAPDGLWAWEARHADGQLVGQLTAWLWPHNPAGGRPHAEACLCFLSLAPGWARIGLEWRLLSKLREELAPRGIRDVITLAYRGPEASIVRDLGFHPRLRDLMAFVLSDRAGELPLQ